MGGKDKFAATAEALRKDTEEKAEAGKKETALAKSELDLARKDPEFAKLLREDAQEELEKSGGSLPFLKVFDVSRSKSKLIDGSRPTHGWFFYGPTKTQYPEIFGNILLISRGFRMMGMPDANGVSKKKYTQIVSGVMRNNGDPEPFWFFVAGSARLKRLWKFQKDQRDMNIATGISTFAMMVTMKTETVDSEKAGQSPATVINFQFETSPDGYPETVASKEEYLTLKEAIKQQERFVQEYILKNEVPADPKETDAIDGESVPEVPQKTIPSSLAQVVPNGSEDVDPDKIPF